MSRGRVTSGPGGDTACWREAQSMMMIRLLLVRALIRLSDTHHTTLDWSSGHDAGPSSRKHGFNSRIEYAEGRSGYGGLVVNQVKRVRLPSFALRSGKNEAAATSALVQTHR